MHMHNDGEMILILTNFMEIIRSLVIFIWKESYYKYQHIAFLFIACIKIRHVDKQ